jgi:DNA repair exonuclease SbcCD ATPase subunit
MTLSVVEIVILQLGAIVLGIAIHFFISSRRSLRASSFENEKMSRSMEDWKSKYFNDIDERDKELLQIKERLSEAEENARIYRTEAEGALRENRQLGAELEVAKKQQSVIQQMPAEKPDYMQQLRMAQSGLMEHNEKINRLLEQIDVIKEKEEQQQVILEEKEELSNQISKLRIILGDKEKEINNIRQKEQLTKEMNSILDNAYSEFNVLQGKIQKLELQLNQSKMVNIEYEDLKETHYKMIRDFEEQKTKLQTLVSENQHFTVQVEELSDKLREANFQRQQLQKRVSYLEELNNDLHVVADANKKLESQLKRMGELESIINVVSEERDELMRRQTNM